VKTGGRAKKTEERSTLSDDGCNSHSSCEFFSLPASQPSQPTRAYRVVVCTRRRRGAPSANDGSDMTRASSNRTGIESGVSNRPRQVREAGTWSLARENGSPTCGKMALEGAGKRYSDTQKPLTTASPPTSSSGRLRLRRAATRIGPADISRRSGHVSYTQQIVCREMVEAPGIEPGSEKASNLADPCSVDDLFLDSPRASTRSGEPESD
jgi:hypothetical protein